MQFIDFENKTFKRGTRRIKVENKSDIKEIEEYLKKKLIGKEVTMTDKTSVQYGQKCIVKMIVMSDDGEIYLRCNVGHVKPYLYFLGRFNYEEVLSIGDKKHNLGGW